MARKIPILSVFAGLVLFALCPITVAAVLPSLDEIEQRLAEKYAQVQDYR